MTAKRMSVYDKGSCIIYRRNSFKTDNAIKGIGLCASEFKNILQNLDKLEISLNITDTNGTPANDRKIYKKNGSNSATQTKNLYSLCILHKVMTAYKNSGTVCGIS